MMSMQVCEREWSTGRWLGPPSFPWGTPVCCGSPILSAVQLSVSQSGTSVRAVSLLGYNISTTLSFNPKPEKNDPCGLAINMTFLSPIVTLCDPVLNSSRVQNHHFQLLLFATSVSLVCSYSQLLSLHILTIFDNGQFFHSFTGEKL